MSERVWIVRGCGLSEGVDCQRGCGLSGGVDCQGVRIVREGVNKIGLLTTLSVSWILRRADGEGKLVSLERLRLLSLVKGYCFNSEMRMRRSNGDKLNNCLP